MKKFTYLFLISIFVIGLMPLSLIDGETTPPVVNITSHTWNQVVSGDIIITATATDSGSGVDYVQFYFGGELITTDYEAPYHSASITVNEYKEGAQTIVVCAFDNDENFAVKNVIVNVVIYNYEYSWSDFNDDDDSDSVWIWLHKYDLMIEDVEAYGLNGDLRKVEFDWYTNDDIDDEDNIECLWILYDSTHYFYPDEGLLNPPSTNPTHVKLIFGPDEVTAFIFPNFLYVHISMLRNGNLILNVGLELILLS